MDTPIRQANPFSEDTPLTRPVEMSFGSLAATYNTIEGQFFVALRRGRDQMPNYLVLGAPGSGKTSLLRALRHQLGHPRSPWNLPDTLPLPLQIDLAATLSRCASDESAPMEFVAERFYSQLEQQLMPTNRAGSSVHPAGIEALRLRWDEMLDEQRSRRRPESTLPVGSADSSPPADSDLDDRARALLRLCESMAVDGLPVESTDSDGGDTTDFAAHMAERYAREPELRRALEQAPERIDSIADGETALSLLHELHLRHEGQAGPASQPDIATSQWDDDSAYAVSLARLFRLVWVPGATIRFVPVDPRRRARRVRAVR